MSWTKHAIWWHVYPLGFTGAPVHADAATEQVTHRLPHLLAWLDYAVELGTSGLALGPVFASTSHGYDTVDHYRIDPRLGDDGDFEALVAACKSRGLRIMLDGVFNHVGSAHPTYAKALAGGDERALFHYNRDGYAMTFEGHPDLIELNHDEPRVEAWVAAVMRHWLAKGVDGWRLDAAYAVDPGFWARVLPPVRAEFPDAVFVGEVIHGDYPDLIRRSTLDSLTQYELWKAIWSSIEDRNLFELDHALQRHNDFLAAFLPLTFTGNHDVTRIASRIGNEGAALAAVVLATVGGMPSIYYGDEQAYHGTKYDRPGGDDEVRPSFPATPRELSGLGARMHRLHQDLIGIRRRNPWLTEARTRRISLENEVFRYRSEAAGSRLDVTLDLRDGHRAQIHDAAGTLLLDVTG